MWPLLSVYRLTLGKVSRPTGTPEKQNHALSACGMAHVLERGDGKNGADLVTIFLVL